MFEWQWVDDLDGVATADRLVGAQRALLAAEAEQLVLATHWADLHAGDFVTARVAMLPGEDDIALRLVPGKDGTQRLLRAAADGCPDLEEYAGAELAALIGTSTAAGNALIWDALAIRHRHPLLWHAVTTGTMRVWVARKVARMCETADLDKAHAEWVDAQTTPYATSLPTKRFLNLVEAKIVEADPTAAEARAKARALARFVHAGQTDEFGLRTIVARASAGDATYLVAVLDRIAGILAEGGDHRPIDVLRAEALRILANPARALALLTQATVEANDPRLEPADELRHEALFPAGDTGWMVDAQGQPLPGSVWNQADLVECDLADTPLADLAVHGSCPVVAASEPIDRGMPAEDADLLRSVLNALEGFDASAFDPVTVVHVHLTDATLAARCGIARVEELGPMVLGELRDWLTHPFSPAHIGTRINLRPVLDAKRIRPVDAYEWPDAMAELSSIRAVYEAFPYGTLRARAADNDHPVPYRRGDKGRARPPGQTSLENNAKLGRFHHRLKTNGGWHLHHEEAGIYWWRTPHGHWLRVDPTGTHHHGRDPDLDARWLSVNYPAA